MRMDKKRGKPLRYDARIHLRLESTVIKQVRKLAGKHEMYFSDFMRMLIAKGLEQYDGNMASD